MSQTQTPNKLDNSMDAPSKEGNSFFLNQTQNAKYAKVTDDTREKMKCWFMWFPIMNLARSFLYDVPMILSTPIKQKLHCTDADIQFLYSAFYLPALVTNFLYGSIQKRFGPRATYLALVVMCTGHFLFWIGLGVEEYWF